MVKVCICNICLHIGGYTVKLIIFFFVILRDKAPCGKAIRPFVDVFIPIYHPTFIPPSHRFSSPNQFYIFIYTRTRTKLEHFTTWIFPSIILKKNNNKKIQNVLFSTYAIAAAAAVEFIFKLFLLYKINIQQNAIIVCVNIIFVRISLYVIWDYIVVWSAFKKG